MNGPDGAKLPQLEWIDDPDFDEYYGEDNVPRAILAMGLLASTRVDEESLGKFKEDVQRRRKHATGRHYYDEWLEIIDKGAKAVISVFRDTGDHGALLRSVISMRAFVTQDERHRIFRAVLGTGSTTRAGIQTSEKRTP